MKTILKRDFFERDTKLVAKELLGKVIVRKKGAKMLYFLITETEAYLGSEDKASHARFGVGGKSGRTKRNEVMYGRGGVWYPYFVYGVHWMLNVVTGEKNKAGAVLIRAGYVFHEVGLREITKSHFVKGPGVVAKKLGIDKTWYGVPAKKSSGMWIEDWGIAPKPRDIKNLPRVGVSYAGEWAGKKLRFLWISVTTPTHKTLSYASAGDSCTGYTHHY